jgi:hypothetical protein
MNAEQYIYESCYAWCTLQFGADVPVIQAFQDAPAPKGTYIAIERPQLTRVGYSHLEEPSDAGNIGHTSQFTATVAFWQVGGYGELLRQLEQDSQFQTIKDFLATRKIAIYGMGNVIQSPRLEEKSYIRESRMELTLGVAVSRAELLGLIETVELINQIGDS